jgi:hypothetical protein
MHATDNMKHHRVDVLGKASTACYINSNIVIIEYMSLA